MLYILFLVSLVAVALVFVWYVTKNMGGRDNSSDDEDEDDELSPLVKEREMKERWKNSDKIVYVDQECQFQMLFPCKWHFDRGSRAHIKATNKTGELTACSTIYWSNYPKIPLYLQRGVFGDAFLISFALYKGVSCSKEEFFKKIGLDDNIIDRIPFKCHTVMGEEITSTEPGTDSEKTTIIFEEDDDYYVFELLFASKNCYDQHIVEQMEDMAREPISIKGKVVWMC